MVAVVNHQYKYSQNLALVSKARLTLTSFIFNSLLQTEDNIMFNIFNVTKDQNELGIEQENPTLSEKYEQVNNEKKKEKPAHGEDGVCCGGCGG